MMSMKAKVLRLILDRIWKTNWTKLMSHANLKGREFLHLNNTTKRSRIVILLSKLINNSKVGSFYTSTPKVKNSNILHLATTNRLRNVNWKILLDLVLPMSKLMTNKMKWTFLNAIKLSWSASPIKAHAMNSKITLIKWDLTRNCIKLKCLASKTTLPLKRKMCIPLTKSLIKQTTPLKMKCLANNLKRIKPVSVISTIESCSVVWWVASFLQGNTSSFLVNSKTKTLN